MTLVWSEKYRQVLDSVHQGRASWTVPDSDTQLQQGKRPRGLPAISRQRILSVYPADE